MHLLIMFIKTKRQRQFMLNKGIAGRWRAGQSALINAICVLFLAFKCASAKKLFRNFKYFSFDSPDMPAGS